MTAGVFNRFLYFACWTFFFLLYLHFIFVFISSTFWCFLLTLMKKLSALPFSHFFSLFCKVLIFNAFVRNRCKKMISTWIQSLKLFYTWHYELSSFLFIYVISFKNYRNYQPKNMKTCNREISCNNDIKIH